MVLQSIYINLFFSKKRNMRTRNKISKVNVFCKFVNNAIYCQLHSCLNKQHTIFSCYWTFIMFFLCDLVMFELVSCIIRSNVNNDWRRWRYTVYCPGTFSHFTVHCYRIDAWAIRRPWLTFVNALANSILGRFYTARTQKICFVRLAYGIAKVGE